MPGDGSPVTSSKPTKIKLKTKKSSAKLNDDIASTRSASPANTNADDSVMSATASQAGDAASVSEPNRQKCKHCKNFYDKVKFPDHSRQCLREMKKMKAQREATSAAAQSSKDKDGDTKMEGNGSVVPEEELKMSVEKATPTAEQTKLSKPKKAAATADAKDKNDSAKKTTNSKKRKAEVAEASEPKPPTKKQKKKDEAKAKAAKPKGPVDVEKQCGVLLPNGAMCARSLTCKSHAMGAKRAVPGRSMPYDLLLAQYQKKNQARQQKAAMASSAPMPDDLALDAPTGPVDSDEEKEAVMTGIMRAAPRPLYSRPLIGVAARTKHVRLKEMLAGALGGSKGGNLFSVVRNQEEGVA